MCKKNKFYWRWCSNVLQQNHQVTVKGHLRIYVLFSVWEYYIPRGGSGEMPILCSRASVSLRLRSKSESSGVISLFCWLSDCSGYTEKNGQLAHHELKKVKTCTFWSKIPTPTFCTHIDVCTHVWIHTQPQLFMCHGLTKSNQTHKRYTLECNTAWVPVVWMYSLFSLPLSSSSPPPSAFFPPWFGRGAASCAPALLLSRFCPTWCPDVASRREEDWTGMRYVQYVTVAICSGIIVTWHSIEDYGLFSDPYASKNPLGVALTRTWYTAVDTRGY